jgi:hypothetical protein
MLLSGRTFARSDSEVASVEKSLAPDGGDAEVREATAGRDADLRIGAGRWKLATDNSLTMLSYDVERGLGMLRVILNCGIFGLVVQIPIPWASPPADPGSGGVPPRVRRHGKLDRGRHEELDPL